MNRPEIEKLLHALGDRIQNEVAITLGGSAALLLQNAISHDANDCDVVAVSPNDAEEAMLAVAHELAPTIEEREWLNTNAMAWVDDFPADWKSRTMEHARYGKFSVSLMSRADCVAMLVLRIMMGEPDQDLTDIARVNLTPEEIEIVRLHVDRLEQEKDFDMSRVRIALSL